MINNISTRLKMFRKKYGLTQQEVEVLAGVSSKSISRWETNPLKFFPINLKNPTRMCKRLRIPCSS